MFAAGAADVASAVTRYENGAGSESELADLLTLIEHADGWNLDARIKSLSNALFTPPLQSETGPLSGGEKRRVALCRALASQPDLLLRWLYTSFLELAVRDCFCFLLGIDLFLQPSLT